jgi:hypothetical protein
MTNNFECSQLRDSSTESLDCFASLATTNLRGGESGWLGLRDNCCIEKKSQLALDSSDYFAIPDYINKGIVARCEVQSAQASLQAQSSRPASSPRDIVVASEAAQEMGKRFVARR